MSPWSLRVKGFGGSGVNSSAGAEASESPLWGLGFPGSFGFRVVFLTAFGSLY